MKATLIALALLPISLACSSAQAASPEDTYIAARDKYIAKFKAAGEVNDTTARQEEAARADLEAKLRAMLGRIAVEGLPPDGNLTLDTLFGGEIGFGQLDALSFQANDDGPRLLVTTPSLAKRWLAAHAKSFGKDNDVPQDLAAALKSEQFYTQAMSQDAAVFRFADIPLAKPANASLVTAMLVARRQDIGLATPDELFIAVLRADRLFIWTAPTQAKAAINPACEKVWNDAAARADKAAEEFKKSDPKDDNPSERILQEGDDAFRRCFAERAPGEPYFAPLTKQAQELVDKLK